MTFTNRLRRVWWRISPRHRDTAKRAVKTFVQAFVPTMVVAALAPDVSLEALWAAAIASAAAAISVTWNTVVKPGLGPVTVVIPEWNKNTTA